MARNRKSQSAAIRFGPALKAVLLCLLIGGSGVGYVWQKEQIAKLGQLKKKKELLLSAQEERNEDLRRKLADLRSPQYLQERIRQANLGLVPPVAVQILRLPEPSAAPARVEPDSRLAARDSRSVFAP